MAMLPEVHVNLDRPTIQHIYQLFLPLIPGGTLVIGLLLTRCFSPLAGASGLVYYSRIVVMVFLAYVAGLMLYALSVFFGAVLSTAASQLCLKIKRLSPFRNNATISQNRVWRTVAAKFLGDPLVPMLPNIPGSGLTTTSLQFPQPVPPAVQQHDLDWNDWYNVLQDYVLRGTYVLPADTLFVWTMIQATGWAIAFVSVRSGLRTNWRVLVIVAPVILMCALMQFWAHYAYYKYDRLTPADFTARLLAEIRAREDASRGGGPTSPTGGPPKA